MGIVITGFGVVSPVGVGAEAFIEGIRAGRSGLKRIEGNIEGNFPMKEACIVEGYDVAKVLGVKKGTRVLDRTAALAVGATALAIKDANLKIDEALETEIGVVLGTLNGSVSRIVELLKETLGTPEPWMVSAEAFPNTVMNFAAGQCAIWHHLRALNTTISGGKLACILALRYARRMIEFGHASSVLAGSVEEFSEMLAWGAEKTSPTGAAPLLGEGSAMFHLESEARANETGRKPRIEILACEIDFDNSGDLASSTAHIIRRALDRAHVGTRDVWALVESGTGPIDAAETQGIADALQGHAPKHRYAAGPHLGYCVSASGALQLGGLIALLSGEEGRGKIGLMTSVSVGGSVGCAVVRGH